jgi:hypothetical protein
LTGLDIDTVGTGGFSGIKFTQGAALHVNKVKIRNVAAFGSDASGILFQPNVNAELYVTDSVITSCGGTGSLSGGIVISPGSSGAVNASINGLRLENNSTGIIVDGTRSSGVAVNAIIVNSVVAGSQHDGVLARAGAGLAVASLSNSQSIGNQTGVSASGPLAVVILDRTTIQASAGQALSSTGGSSIYSYGNNPINDNAGGLGASLTVIGLH